MAAPFLPRLYDTSERADEGGSVGGAANDIAGLRMRLRRVRARAASDRTSVFRKRDLLTHRPMPVRGRDRWDEAKSHQDTRQLIPCFRPS